MLHARSKHLREVLRPKNGLRMAGKWRSSFTLMDHLVFSTGPSLLRLHARIIRMLRTSLVAVVVFVSSFMGAQDRAIRIYADNAFDRRGKVLHNVQIEVRGAKISSI